MLRDHLDQGVGTGVTEMDNQGSNPCPLHKMQGVLTTGLPGKSQGFVLFSLRDSLHVSTKKIYLTSSPISSTVEVCSSRALLPGDTIKDSTSQFHNIFQSEMGKTTADPNYFRSQCGHV